MKKRTTMAIRNSQDLNREFQWFRQVLDTRLKLYFGQESEFADIREIKPPHTSRSKSNWAALLRKYKPDVSERLALVLALLPHVAPHLLDVFFIKNAQFDRPYTEFGGYVSGIHKGFVPTGETLLFLLAANSLDQRFSAMRLFSAEHYFSRDDILTLEKANSNDLPLSGILTLSEEYLFLLTHGEMVKPVLAASFPAEEIRTSMEWSDLVLSPQTHSQIREIETWINYSNTFLYDWGMADKIRPGYRALFYGAPGTGKTITARLLGKSTGQEVYRIDPSIAVSGYIGETEKNLARVFRQAENKNWILFFDEADALFGKRTETRSADDRYANLEVGYLMQRIESFKGIVILATNYKNDMDEAFIRQFEAIIEFPMPGPAERLRIWQHGIPAEAKLESNIDLTEIAKRFEISGGAIMNVIRYASLEALRNGTDEIRLSAIQQGVRRELVKAGQMV